MITVPWCSGWFWMRCFVVWVDCLVDCLWLVGDLCLDGLHSFVC